MGNKTAATNKEKAEQYEAEGSSFFIKQMITKSQISSLEGEYKMGNKIGEGTYAQVFRAESIRTGRVVAIKKVDKTKAKGMDIILNNEFDILRELDHPNIIKIFNLYEDFRYFYMVTELIPGVELYDHFKTKKQLSEKESFGIFYQVLLAINHLHLNKIMHRDIKLENLMFDAQTQTIKIIDFGSARDFETEEPTQYKCVGTASYVAPEVINKFYNKKCDNWSLGIFLYLLLSGNTPFTAESQEKTFHNIQNAPLEFDRPGWEKVSKEAKDLITGLLEKDPKKRLTLKEVIDHPWVHTHHSSDVITPEDQGAVMEIFNNMRKFRSLKISEIQLGVLVFMINFVIVPKDEQRMVRCFHWIDIGGDGVIDQRELALAMIEYEDRPKKKAEEEAKSIMDKIDFNKSKDISFSEFLVSAIDIEQVLTEQNLKRAFNMIDFDFNGTLSADELKQHLGEHISKEYYQNLIRFFDDDHDGEISLPEFKRMMLPLLKN